MFKQNEGQLDKNIRLAIGLIALLLGLFIFTDILQIIALAVAALAFFTGLTGFCGLYKLLGISTKK
ncbi:MAG: DUF2892 domain-containing protein [Candidatus Shapirobacteria bacterium]